MLNHLAQSCIASVGRSTSRRLALTTHHYHTVPVPAACGRRTAVVFGERAFSSIPSNDPQATFMAQPPTELSLDMARGIQEGNKLILRHGVGQQRLQLLASTPDLPLVQKWQRMMEIYLGAQLHVIAGLGYQPNEQGIMNYTQHLARFVGGCDLDTQEEFRVMGRETWRAMLATAFNLDEDTILPDGKEMSIVDARNTVHKVASKLMEPAVLEMVAEQCGKLPHEADPQMEMAKKHQIIQDIVVNQVYLGGSPSLVEELGFGQGNQAYAKMQYVMAYHENDPLCSQYTSSAMVRIWQAAGLDLSQSPQAATMPMSGTPGP